MRGTACERWRVVSGCLSLVFATLTLQSLVPADLVDRYLAPALPAVVVIAFIGIGAIYDFLIRNQPQPPESDRYGLQFTARDVWG